MPVSVPDSQNMADTEPVPPPGLGKIGHDFATLCARNGASALREACWSTRYFTLAAACLLSTLLSAAVRAYVATLLGLLGLFACCVTLFVQMDAQPMGTQPPAEGEETDPLV